MTTRDAIALVSFIIAISALYIADQVVLIMMAEINRKRSKDNLMSYVGFTLPKVLSIFREYRERYPDSNLHIYAWAVFAIAVGSMFVFMVSFGILGST